MVEVGPAGYPAGSKGPVDAVERAAAMGFSALEVQFVRQARMAEANARAAGRRAKELGVLLSAHAPYYVNFNSPSHETRAKSEEWVLRSARICHQLGAWILVVHAASYSGSGEEECTEAVVEALSRLREAMGAEGLEDVTLGLETMGKLGSWGTLEEIGDVARRVRGTAPVLDFAHLHARSRGGMNSPEGFERALRQARSFHKARLHCHFSCIEYTAQGERRHLPLASRSPDYSLAVAALRRFKGGLTLISETPPPEEGARAMLELLA
ncbi:MAG: TIM barrel protein [Methanomassiliicoccales archaeon]|jgi:deoxyribonuclease-4|nr:TIM barrel protein [Methanomassiliicoccales archaeon]